MSRKNGIDETGMTEADTRPHAGGKLVFMNSGNKPVGKKISARLAVIFLLVFIVTVSLFVAGYTGWLSAERIALKFIDAGKDKTASDNLPMEMNGLKVFSVDDIGYCFGVLDELKYSIYSPECNLIYSFSHNMSSPVTVSSERRVLMYESGNYRLLVFSRKGEEFSKIMDNEVITADMNVKNQVAVATLNDRYLGQVTVFDSSGNEVLTWYSADSYVTDVALSEDGKRFAVTLLRVENGEEISRVCIFEIGETEPSADFSFEGETVFEVRRLGESGFLTVGTSSAAFFNGASEMTGKYQYGGESLTHFTVAGSDAFFVFDPEDGTGNLTAVTVNPSGDEKARTVLETAEYVCGAEDGRVYVCAGGAVTGYEAGESGEYRKFEVKTDGQTIRVLPKGEKMLILSIGGIDVFDISYALQGG